MVVWLSIMAMKAAICETNIKNSKRNNVLFAIDRFLIIEYFPFTENLL